MGLLTVVRYGLPFAFVHCTIYQQDIWKEGDERLILEQKRVWRDFFSYIDTGYNTVANQLNLSRDKSEFSLVSKFDSFNLKDRWNNRVMRTPDDIDRMGRKLIGSSITAMKNLGIVPSSGEKK